MKLSPGVRIGPYEIIAEIGAGGMGEVYRARDTLLNRDVALKVLPAAFAGDADRLARFTREAQTLAALNHPNIAAIYGLEKTPDLTALVMELVEGEDLSAVIARGALPLVEALPIAKQIVEALEAAHEQGIVHRDLKPANIKVRADGTVKVLDFGLAKAYTGDSATGSGPDLSQSPTLAHTGTAAGIILGTAAYMSPEQARGKKVDKRADIWAFGVVLYEMLAGKRLFQGEDLTDILASVVKEQPDLSAAPAKVRRLLALCLEKDPKKRLRDIGDAWKLTEEAPAAVAPSQPRRAWLPWAVAGVLAVAVGVFAYLWLRTPAPDTLSVQFEIGPPGAKQFTATALSPDGRYVVFGAGQEGSAQLWLRPLGSLTARPLQGTEGANLPFWSPDSKSIGFYQDGKLKRADIIGGAPQLLADAAETSPAGGTWNRDGTILFASAGGLFRVAASGGVPQKVTEPDTGRKESDHGHPQFLPDGNHFLYFIRSSDPNVQGIYAASLDNPKDRVRIVVTDRQAYYAPPRGGSPGYLLWMREETLLAQRFDAGKLSLTGDPAPVAEDILLGPPARAPFWTSDAGVLAYRTGTALGNVKLVWMSRDGKVLGEARKEDRYGSLRLSPDGKRVAMGRSEEGGRADVWVFEFARQVMTRLTFDPAPESLPVWSPDGSQVAYRSERGGVRQIYRTASGGGGKEEQLTTGPNPNTPSDWSRDGRWLLSDEEAPKTGYDILALPLEGERKPVVVLQTQFDEMRAQFSPDGRWIAYESNPTQRDEIYVRPFPPGPGSPYQVSNQGGTRPKWRADGKELFYLAPGRNAILAAGVRATGPGFESDAPRELFRMSAVPGNVGAPYEVSADGQRFLILQPAAQSSGQSPLTVVTNWQELMKK